MEENNGVHWLLSLTTDELITLNGIMYGLQLAVEKERMQGYGSKMILDIALKVDRLKRSALGMLNEFHDERQEEV